MDNIGRAEKVLKRTLTESFGRSLHGIVSYGRRWDPRLKAETLGVVVDTELVSDAKVKALPSDIGGVNIQVLKAGRASLD